MIINQHLLLRSGWFRSFICDSDTTLLKEHGHMWPEPALDVVWAVSTYMHLEYTYIWPSSHQPVIQGLSRDSVSELVLNSTQSVHEGISLIHDFSLKIRTSFPLQKLVNDLSWHLGSSTAVAYYLFSGQATLLLCVGFFLGNQDILTDSHGCLVIPTDYVFIILSMNG